MDLLKTGIILTAIVLFTFACGQPAANVSVNNSKSGNAANQNTSGANAAPAASAVKDETAQATELYTKNCMTCHKDSGKGGKVTVDGKNLDVDDLTTDKMKKRADEKLAEQISEGAPDDGMPAFKDKLKPAEIALVVKHVRTLQAK